MAKPWTELARMLRFFGVALVATAVDAGVAMACLHGAGWPLSACVVAGFMAGLGVAYALHHAWTFAESRSEHKRSLPRFLVSNAVLLGGRIAFVWLCTQALLFAGVGMTRWIESGLYVVMLGASFLVNYVMCRLWVFR